MADGSARFGYAVSGADGTPIFYSVTRARAVEAAPTVVFCDGIGCDGYVWKYLRRDLEDDHRIIHWHYRGHGRSRQPTDPGRVAIADCADDLAAVLDDTDTPDAILFGHSMGVQVCLEAYRRHRSRVRALILVCGAPEHPLRTFRGTPLLENVLPAMRAAVGRAPRFASALTRRLLPTKLSYAIATRLEVNGQLLERDDFMPYLRGMSRVEPSLFLAMLDQAGRHSAADLLPQIQAPVLIVAGRRDGFTPPELSRSMQEAIPDAELLMVDQGSHTAPLERPEYINSAITDFLQRRLG